LDGKMRKAFSRVLVRDLHPGKMASLQLIGTMQAPRVALWTHLCQMGRIPQQDPLLGLLQASTQTHLQEFREKPEQLGNCLVQTFVPGLRREHSAGDSDETTPAAEFSQGGETEHVAE
jgi:hypothetical protein